MFDLVVSAGFEDIGETYNVGVYVGVGVFKTVANASLCCEVDDGGEVVFVEQLLHGRSSFQSNVMEGKARMSLQVLQSCFLQIHIVIIIEIVYSDNIVAIVQQPLC